MKYTSLATDKTIYKNLKKDPSTKDLAKIYSDLTVQRMDKYAISQLIKNGRYAISFDAAILFSFRRTTKKPNTKENPKLTKQELKIARLAYEISQADLSYQIITTLFYNDKLSNNLKLLSQIKQYVDNNTNETNTIAAALNISLSTKKTKEEEENKDDKSKPKAKPLKLQPPKLQQNAS